MRAFRFVCLALAALPASAVGSTAQAQSLADRVASAPAGRVQFHFASRDGVCGNGRTFFTSGGSMWYGSWNEATQREACVEGPIRVLLDRAGREVISISTFAGPVQPAADGTTDLGTVRAADAASYLLGLAETALGRVSRDAITPAMLADSVDNTSRLLVIAANQSAARETRRSAISWLGRPAEGAQRNVADIAATLLAIARDQDDNRAVRQSALRTLARLEHGAGTSHLMTLAGNAADEWLAREAVSALSSSGDPRSRGWLRQVVRDARLPDDVMASAVRALGNGYATGEDVALLRDIWAKLPGDRSRDAAVSAVANFGGAENVRWLVTLAKNPDAESSTRRKAMQAAYRGGTSIGEIIAIHDETTDAALKTSIMTVLLESGERAGLDKLMQIAREGETAQHRRRAVSLLGRSSDQRVREFLASIATSR